MKDFFMQCVLPILAGSLVSCLLIYVLIEMGMLDGITMFTGILIGLLCGAPGMIVGRFIQDWTMDNGEDR